MRVSQMMTKQQVITLYLNEVDLGHNTFGIAAAAQTYFDKPLGQLDIAQAATSAGIDVEFVDRQGGRTVRVAGDNPAASAKPKPADPKVSLPR